MPKPAKNARKCGLQQIPGIGEHSRRNVETVSLFDLKRVNGWWPAAGTDNGEQILAVCLLIYHLLSNASLLSDEQVNLFIDIGS